MKWAPRIGLLLLLLALGAFEALFLAERTRGHEALQAERTLRSARATELLHEELQRQFDVGEARLEALETLPLLEEDGLVWVREGVQWLPRVPGVLDGGAETPAVVDALAAFAEGDAGALDALGSASPLSAVVKKKGSAQERLFRAWPWLEKRQAAELCVRSQRATPGGTELVARCQRGLAGERVTLGVGSYDTLVLEGGWLVRATPGEVRGVAVSLDATLSRVKELLSRRAMMEPGDSLSVEALPLARPDAASATPQPRALPSLVLQSPRLDAAEAALTSAFWWKTALLALTAFLGLAVVFLMRLTEARERATLSLQRDFISTVSHELRTPLASIRVLAETLERKLGAEPTGPAKDYPRRLVSAVDGLGFLVENILSFNRIEAGRLTPKKEPLALTALEAMLRDDLALMVERPVQLECEGLAALGTIEADVTLVRILVLNLLRNTWKYARADNPTPHLWVRGAKSQRGVVLTFTDDGPGIAADAHERVFEPFHRQPGAEHVRGSGLGLALSRRIAELHGGTLRIATSSERGTTFELTLPR